MVKLELINKQVIATVYPMGIIIGQAYSTRELALAVYFKEAHTLAEMGLLHEDSSIIN